MDQNAPQPPKLGERFLWVVGLGALFVIVYGGANWVTSKRSDVGVIQFEWEAAIPVLPWMIVPYMSIDLFFIASFFVCRSKSELRIHGLRMLLATVLAPICFLLVPMKLAATRPEMGGVPGFLHDLLKLGDQPYNLYPSLHVTYLLLLWPLYHRYTRGVFNAVLHIWFGLVLLSVLFVHQHHFIDMIGGAALAITILYVIPSQSGEITAAFVRRPEVALRYAVGAVLLLVIAHIPNLAVAWRVLAAWIAVALIVMSCAYLFAGPRIYRKSGGRIPFSARVLLAPHMLGLWVTRMYWSRQSPSGFDCVVPELWLGRVLRSDHAARLLQNNIVAVLDMTAEHAECAPLRSVNYRNIQVLDTTLPTIDHLREAVAFIKEHAVRGPVFVHCGLGYTRSAAVAAAYCLSNGHAATVEQAIEVVRKARCGIVLKPELIEVLQAYRSSLT
jgi:protein-tyrosine phosphatase/membrane-associated phospholipid phosphatase